MVPGRCNSLYGSLYDSLHDSSHDSLRPEVGAHAKGAALGHGKEHTMRRLNPSLGPMEGHAKDDLSLEVRAPLGATE